jgi:putative hydrolase of the HAD superfamily
MTIPMSPLAVLFDADGVIQRPATGWQDRLVAMAGATERDAEAFLADVFAAEAPCLTGSAEFAPALAGVLRRWNAPCSVDDVIDVWTNIHVDHEVLEVIAELRASGIFCYLTTNQHARRADRMSRDLGYETRFDREFYSCRVGHAKPGAEFFRAVLEATVLPPSRVLFIDDHARNVEVARELGIHAALFPYGAGALMLRCTLQEFGVRNV